jgi:hypothetical protein
MNSTPSSSRHLMNRSDAFMVSSLWWGCLGWLYTSLVVREQNVSFPVGLVIFAKLPAIGSTGIADRLALVIHCWPAAEGILLFAL